MSLPYPYYPYPYWPREQDRSLHRPVTVVIVVVIIMVAARMGWTPDEILRLLAMLRS